MDAREIVSVFGHVPEAGVTALQNRITVYVPAVDDSVHVVADDVQRVSRIYAPDGAPALEFVISDGSRVWPLIITGADVVFAPERADVILDSGMRYAVVGMPPLVAYTEMVRDAEYYGRDVESGHVDLDNAAGTFLRTRCFIVGAARFGLRPLAAVHWWERGWRRVGRDVCLPAFRPDPLWAGLVEEADEAARAGRLTGTALHPPSDERAAVARLSTADFERLKPGLTVTGLDDEFVAAWKGWMPVTPATFHAVITRGIPGANADVHLYPEGGGGVDLVIPVQDGRRAFLQLRLSFPAGDMAIEEIRIPDGVGGGLFQRLMFNTERLAALLGIGRVTLYATGVGAYALARVGVYPREPELYRVTRDQS